jgi:hypothetical protein
MKNALNRSRRCLAGLVVGVFCLGALPSAHAQFLTVNFASDQGPVLRRGQGYLSSWWHTRESPRHGNLELKPTSWRIGYWGTWDCDYQPMVDQGVNHIQVILTDAEAREGIRYGFCGRMDEVLVARRAFSAKEIVRLYATGRP